MTNFSENDFKKKEKIKRLLIITIIFLIIAGVYIYNSTYYIIVRFDELGPLTKNMSAYYNGFKVGRIVNIEPDIDFKHTLVKVNLIHTDLNLPQNTVAYVESFPNGELYLQFLYPQSPSLIKLKRGDVLEGIGQSNLEQFMMGQSISGMTDVVSVYIIKALNSADAANQEIKLFFEAATDIIEENTQVINTAVTNTRATTKSLAQMAENLNQASKKINDALDEEILRDTTSNIKDTTDNIAKATKDMDKTMQKIDDTITHANATAQNLNSMTSGLNETLCKRFAGMRIIFGTPVKAKNCTKNSCN